MTNMGHTKAMTINTRIKLIVIYIGYALQTIILHFLFMVPLVNDVVAQYWRKEARAEEAVPDVKDYVRNFATLRSWRGMVRSSSFDLLKRVTLHGEMYDADLHHLDGTPCKLSEFAKPMRPLVINFGSGS